MLVLCVLKVHWNKKTNFPCKDIQSIHKLRVRFQRLQALPYEREHIKLQQRLKCNFRRLWLCIISLLLFLNAVIHNLCTLNFATCRFCSLAPILERNGKYSNELFQKVCDRYLLSKIQYLESSFVIHYHSAWKLKMKQKQNNFSLTVIAFLSIDLCNDLFSSMKEFFVFEEICSSIKKQSKYVCAEWFLLIPLILANIWLLRHKRF